MGIMMTRTTTFERKPIVILGIQTLYNKYFRIELQKCRSSGSLVLYHFVGSASSHSADPALMIRRLMVQVRLILNFSV